MSIPISQFIPPSPLDLHRFALCVYDSISVLQIRLTSQVALVVKDPSAKAGDLRDASSIPRTEEPGGLQSVGLQRVRQNSAHMQARTTKVSDTGRFNREELLQRISN